LGPVKTKFGLSIYKIITISPEKQSNYEDIVKDIKKKLIKELSLEMLFEKLDEIEDLIAEGNDIEEIAKSNTFNKTISVRNLNKISKTGLVYSYDGEPTFLDKKPQFIKNIWNTEVNELSEIFNLNDDNYYIIGIVNQNKSETPTFNLIKNRVFDQWLKQELIFKTKEKTKNIVTSKNNKLLYKSSLKRNDKTLGNINNQYLITKIFDIEHNEIEYIETADNLIAIKVVKTRTDNYKFDKKTFNDLNLSFSKSFFNDISESYVQHLASKHKLQRNYKELENYFVNQQNN